MKIAIIGPGRVGTILGDKWLAKGHQVIYGSRSPDKRNGTSIISQRQAVEQSDIIVLTIPGNVMQDVVPNLNLGGKIVIDTTNSPNSGMDNSMPHAPLAKWVKAFNTIGHNIMTDPEFNNSSADGFFCCDDDHASDTVSQLISDIGMNPLKVGNNTFVKDLENLAWLWIKMSRTIGTRDFAFKLIKK